MPRYKLNDAAFEHARELIEKKQYILTSDWGERQPSAEDQNRFLVATPGTSTRPGTSG